MGKTLGIYVSSDRHLDKLIRLCRAARTKGVTVRIFFTAEGTRLITDPRLKALNGCAEIALCKVGFEGRRLKKDDAMVGQGAFLNQSWNAETIYHCDRFIAF